MASSHDLVLTTVPGGSALSPFRAAALLARLQEVVPSVTGLSARHVHQVASHGPLDADTLETVTRLLTYGPPASPEPPGGHLTTIVVSIGLSFLIVRPVMP